MLLVRFEFLRGQRIADLGELFEFVRLRHRSAQLHQRLPLGAAARDSPLRHLRLQLPDAAVALGGAVLPLGDVVRILVLAAAWARLLHRSVEHTYLAVPVLVVYGFALGIDALVALKEALVLHLVNADDLRAALADEALVGPLAVLVAVLEELGDRIIWLHLLDRLVADIVLRLVEVVIDDLERDTVRLVLRALNFIVAHLV